MKKLGMDRMGPLMSPIFKCPNGTHINLAMMFAMSMEGDCPDHIRMMFHLQDNPFIYKIKSSDNRLSFRNIHYQDLLSRDFETINLAWRNVQHIFPWDTSLISTNL